ncbi:MAG: WecB/TagA/CpsF family glycosyltransferase, partial [Pirellulales bacterium]|nr:WecB/TagA/CpsF family glycosyltransferase [Pirellulales bacterium]
LFVAFGQPKGELWLAEHVDELGVPACVQIGASLDFVAGRVRRAPRWVQRAGGEWLYRITREPGRMIPRYAANAVFMIRAMLRDAFRPAV